MPASARDLNPRVVVTIAVMLTLTLVNSLWPRTPSPISSSTFGRAGSGHGALFDLLAELGASEGRSLEATARLTGAGTVWWIDPLGVCDARIAMTGEVDVLDAEEVAWRGGEWIRGGGTGVVFLQSADPGGPLTEKQELLVACDAIAGVKLPTRTRLGTRQPLLGLRGSAAEIATRLESDTIAFRGFVSGAVVGAPRDLAQRSFWAFDESLDWAAAAEITGPGTDPRPFVLSHPLGDGLLVVVADSGFTHNRWLDAADAAPLAVDMVAAYGAPRFDEREHGFLPETGIARFIAQSPALPVFLGLALLGGLYAWRGGALPPRSVAEFDPAAPTLDTFVRSMGTLYAKSRDHGRVLKRYREFTASRLKRHFGLEAGVSDRALAERIARIEPHRQEPHC